MPELGSKSAERRRWQRRGLVLTGGIMAGATIGVTIVAADMSLFTGIPAWLFFGLIFATGGGLGLVRWRFSDALAAVVVGACVSIAVALALWTLPGSSGLEREMFLGGSLRKLFLALFWAVPFTIVGVLVGRFLNPALE